MAIGPYVLITPAKNEDQYIEKPIRSVLDQTLLPQKWVIISDGSVDRTDEIVEGYAQKHRFIHFLKNESGENRCFGSKVNAIHAGYKELSGLEYEFIGILDADVSFESSYFASILREFQKNPKLGLAGGIILEMQEDQFVTVINSPDSVAGAVQLFRRECYDQIGGFLPLKLGGEDAAAEITARMHGWEVKTFPEYPVYHHKRIGSGSGHQFTNLIRRGKIDYQLGYLFLFELTKCIHRLIESPYLIGSFMRMWGYLSAWIQREPRAYSEPIVRFLQEEQKSKLKKMLSLKSTHE